MSEVSWTYSSFRETNGWSRLAVYTVFWMSLIGMGFDLSLAGSIQASSQWQEYFNHPSGSLLGILTAIATLGMVVGAFPASYLNNIYGRRAGLLVGGIIVIIAVILQTAAKNIGMYLAGRFLTGFGLLFAHNASPAMLTEFAPKNERSVALNSYIGFYNVGAIIMGWTCYGTVTLPTEWSWRGPCLLQLLAPVVQLAALPFIPESPRWLVLHGKEDAALNILIRYHGGGVETPEVTEEFNEIKLATVKQVEEPQTRWLDLVASKSMRIRTAIVVFTGIASQMSGNAVVSFYYVTIMDSIGYTDPHVQTIYSSMLSVFNLLWSVGMAPVSQRVGRRPMFMWGATWMLITFTILSASQYVYNHQENPNKDLGAVVLAMIYLFNMGYEAVWSTLFLYPSELFPTQLRSKALGLQAMFDYGSLFISLFANPIAIDNIGVGYYWLYVGLIAIEIVVIYSMFIETNKFSVEQIVDYWDGALGERPGSKKMMQDAVHVMQEKRAVAVNWTSSNEREGVESDKDVDAIVAVLPK